MYLIILFSVIGIAMIITELSSNKHILGELGTRIRAARIDMSLTQAELATRAGVSLSTVAKLERGEDVRLSSVLDTLRALGILASVNALVPETAPRPSELATLGRTRQRARSTRQKKSKTWKWGDEQ